MGPGKAPEGTNTKVTSAKGHFCAYPSDTPGKDLRIRRGAVAAAAERPVRQLGEALLPQI